MALEEIDKQWIERKIKENTQFSQRILGDRPTDANQLVNKRYVNSYVLYGEINGGGTAVFLPTGWTSVGNAAGLVTVTHNLGTSNYGVIATAAATGFDRDFVCNISNRSNNSFQVETILSGSDTYANFFFVLILRP